MLCGFALRPRRLKAEQQPFPPYTSFAQLIASGCWLLLQAYLLLGLESYSEPCLCVWNCTTHLVIVDPVLQGDGFYLCHPSTGSKLTEKNVVRMGNCGNGVKLQRIIAASRDLRSYVLLLKM